VAHPNKKTRKAKNKNKKRVTTQAQVRALQVQQAKLAEFALNEHEKANHLAKLLAFVVAKYGKKGELFVSDQQLAMLPDDAQLNERYDVATDSLVLRTLLAEAEDDLLASTEEILTGSPTPIMIVAPESKIEVVSA
jgi:hypothetical protein